MLNIGLDMCIDSVIEKVERCCGKAKGVDLEAVEQAANIVGTFKRYK
jgi:hypothetical protein